MEVELLVGSTGAIDEKIKILRCLAGFNGRCYLHELCGRLNQGYLHVMDLLAEMNEVLVNDIPVVSYFYTPDGIEVQLGLDVIGAIEALEV